MMANTPCLELNRPQIMEETIDGEVVVIDMETGSYFSIRGSGVDIWNRLQSPEPIELLVSEWGSADSASGDAAGQIREFLAELEREHLVRRVLIEDPTYAPTRTGSNGAEPPSSFEPPVIEKFTDMEDLLLLDPVHEVDERGWPHLVPGS